MSHKNVAKLLVETLEAAGVRHCYGIVGDTLNYVTEAIHSSSIDWVHVRHEEAAAFAAGAESYISGRLTACAGSCGPGSLHFINGVFEAQRNGAPMVLIASQLATNVLGSDFPQEVDFKVVYSSCSVYCEQILSAEQAPHVITMACQAALNKCGVAVIILPTDISKLPVSASAPTLIHHPKPAITPNTAELNEIARLLSAGNKVAIYAGYGCADAHDLLVELATRLKAPVAHTSRAKDFVEYDNPFNVGMTGMLGIKSGFHALTECDTLLLLGTDFAWSQFYPSKATLIQVDLNATHLGRRHPVHLGVVGDVQSTLQALLPLVTEKTEHTFLDECLALHQQALAQRRKEEQPGTDSLIHPQYLASLLDHYADEDALFTADVGSCMVWLLRHIHSNGQRRTLTSLLHGTMANAMPQALGLKKAYPARQVISLSGDGGLAMLLGDLLTAVQENLPIKIVVVNNASLNFVELEQKTEGLLDHYTNLENPDFAKVAQAIGFYGQQVHNSAELEEAVKNFLAEPGPALLNVHTNAYELVMPPSIEVKQVADTALYAAKALLDGRFKDVEGLITHNFLKK